MLFMSTAAMPGRNPPRVVPAAGFGFLLEQAGIGFTLMKVIMLDLNDSTAPWRCWFCLNNCHD
jgi:hypothetical protein